MSDINDKYPPTDDLDPPPKKDGRFQPGHVPAVHRKKGTQNKITQDLRKGIVEGAAEHGEDGKGKGGLVGYLEFCARKHPKAYLGLLGKLLPYNLAADIKEGTTAIFEIVAVPPGRYITVPQDVLDRQPKIIDQPPATQEPPSPEPGDERRAHPFPTKKGFPK